MAYIISTDLGWRICTYVYFLCHREMYTISDWMTRHYSYEKQCWRLAQTVVRTKDVTFIIYDILFRHFKTQLFEILLFCLVNTGCFVEYNACYVLHFVTAIILRHTKNIYEICNCKPHRLKANFLTNTVMQFSFKSINIWKSYCKNTKGSRFYESRYRQRYERV